MLEQELGVVQQGPEQILGGPPAVLGVVGDFGDGQLGFGRIGAARQGRQEELVHERRIIGAGFQQLADPVFAGR